MKQAYIINNFHRASLKLIDTINGIVDEYLAQGYRLTVRQLYYQLVARDVIPNVERSYKNIIELVNNGRLAGLIDWDAIEDRTRAFISRSAWRSGREILDGCATQFHMDMWATQQTRVFVIVEKEALAGVLERVCNQFDCPLLAARGYPSISVLREFAEERLVNTDQRITLLHLGDHDPSGIDMTRDLIDRLEILAGGSFVLKRIALTMKQIKEQNPPPNPAKITDSRFEGYRQQWGDESWELDALQPAYLNKLVAKEIERHIDRVPWDAKLKEIEGIKKRIAKVAAAF